MFSGILHYLPLPASDLFFAFVLLNDIQELLLTGCPFFCVLLGHIR